MIIVVFVYFISLYCTSFFVSRFQLMDRPIKRFKALSCQAFRASPDVYTYQLNGNVMKEPYPVSAGGFFFDKY